MLWLLYVTKNSPRVRKKQDLTPFLISYKKKDLTPFFPFFLHYLLCAYSWCHLFVWTVRKIVVAELKCYGEKLVRILFICIGYLLLSGCTPVEPLDVSDEPKYKEIIGIKYQTLDELIATAITSDRNYKPIVSSVRLARKPGFDGPEVIFRKLLSKGLILEVVGVYKGQVPFTPELFYQVKIRNRELYDEYIVLIYVPNDIENSNHGADELLFKKL